MKKVLVLTLVLGIASLASAGLTMSATDQGGGTFLIKVVQDAQNATGSGGEIYIDYTGGTVANVAYITDYASAPAGVGWNWSISAAGATTVGSNAAIKYSGTPNLGAGTPGVGSNVGGFGPVLAYDSTLSLELTILEETTVNMTGGWDGATLNQSLTIGEIPEPATMVLLGLGALVLRRKK